MEPPKVHKYLGRLATIAGRLEGTSLLDTYLAPVQAGFAQYSWTVKTLKSTKDSKRTIAAV